jgi:hypothetical protein
MVAAEIVTAVRVLKAARILLALAGKDEAAVVARLRRVVDKAPKTAKVLRLLVRVAAAAGVERMPLAGSAETTAQAALPQDPTDTFRGLLALLGDMARPGVGAAALDLAASSLLAGAHPKLRPLLTALFKGRVLLTSRVLADVWNEAPEAPAPADLTEAAAAAAHHLNAASRALLQIISQVPDPPDGLTSRAMELHLLVSYAATRAEFLRRPTGGLR